MKWKFKKQNKTQCSRFWVTAEIYKSLLNHVCEIDVSNMASAKSLADVQSNHKNFDWTQRHQSQGCDKLRVNPQL